MDQSTIALIITMATLILFVMQLFPIAVTALLAAIAMAVFGIIDFKDIMAQFGNANMFSIVCLMIMGATMFETGLAQKIGQALLGKWKDNEKAFVVVLLIVVAICASFFTMITTTAMFLPVVSSVAQNSNGKISKKNTYMAVGFAATLGGCGTLIAFPSQHSLINNLLIESGNEPMSFFYGAKATAAMLIIMILYFTTIGRKIQEKTFNFQEKEDPLEEVPEGKEFKTWKMVLSGIIMAITISLIVSGVLVSGVAALLGSTAMIVLGCIDIQTALRKVHWEIVVMAGALFAFASGFNRSGASSLCVNTILKIFGNDTSKFLLYAVMVLTAMILTYIIDNVAAAALVAPIALEIAQQFGLNATPVLFSILMGCNIAYATPISCPCISMTTSAGYRFNDYLRFGGPLSLLIYIGTIVLVPLMYGL